MLDKDTKKKIDDARDILVGKVPDPKSQVEQITIALIYKFMDDMDNEAVEMGGKASFFTGKYAKYAWTKLFDKKLGSHEMLFLYTEALTQLPLHTGKDFPQLFRDIFKNAFLPYRDPETLKLFLKTINGFTYDHSERLGDAFEYLLSVLGSQGDAGQFRTPRNIIDFIVAVMDPKKNETICDPACGTAGFLISSYKHILEQNKKKNPGDLLKPDERKALVKNIRGYDISPDMVRLSLVNLYLHHFSNPQIVEYDTLTSEDRWKESFDVIMANPPFMSPKGGITPHKRFKVTSNRSEVLFVDYIAEHINPVTGRAGVIVPEGIIFQSATAYKALRKMLVDNYLYAVVSLPAGVFNPYSGVKTSILLMDKAIAKKSNEILFIKIENDGYTLGAQRRGHDKNDLPDALNLLRQYKEAVHKGAVEELKLMPNALIVGKDKIGENGEYNLSVDRYVDSKVKVTSWDIAKIGEYVTIDNGRVLTEFDVSGKIACIKVSDMNLPENQINIITSSHWVNETQYKLLPVGSVLFPKRGAAIATNKKRYTQIPCLIDNNCMGLIVNRPELNSKYLFYFLLNFDLSTISNSAGIALINNADISNVKIPLPPLSVQQEIVNKIESWQKIIDGAKQVLENYKPQIDIDPKWEMVELGEVCEKMSNGVNFSKEQLGIGTKFVNIKDVFSEGIINTENLERVDLTDKEILRNQLQNEDIIFVRSSVKYEGVGFPSLFIEREKEPIVFCGFLIKATLNKKLINPRFLLYLLRTSEYRNKTIFLSNKANITNISQDNLKRLVIPLPTLAVQKQIVDLIEKEQTLVNANKELAAIYEQKIKDEINKLWQGEEKKQKGSKKKKMETA